MLHVVSTTKLTLICLHWLAARNTGVNKVQMLHDPSRFFERASVYVFPCRLAASGCPFTASCCRLSPSMLKLANWVCLKSKIETPFSNGLTGKPKGSQPLGGTPSCLVLACHVRGQAFGSALSIPVPCMRCTPIGHGSGVLKGKPKGCVLFPGSATVVLLVVLCHRSLGTPPKRKTGKKEKKQQPKSKRKKDPNDLRSSACFRRSPPRTSEA